jgi:hypothetical protein
MRRQLSGRLREIARNESRSAAATAAAFRQASRVNGAVAVGVPALRVRVVLSRENASVYVSRWWLSDYPLNDDGVNAQVHQEDGRHSIRL